MDGWMDGRIGERKNLFLSLIVNRTRPFPNRQLSGTQIDRSIERNPIALVDGWPVKVSIPTAAAQQSSSVVVSEGSFGDIP